jgi:hypothetical protein
VEVHDSKVHLIAVPLDTSSHAQSVIPHRVNDIFVFSKDKFVSFSTANEEMSSILYLSGVEVIQIFYDIAIHANLHCLLQF